MPDDTASEFLEVLQRLSDQQSSTFERLLLQRGMACNLNQQYVQSLAMRLLCTTVVDPLTNDTRLCEHGCGHVWYDIPAAVQDAYERWSAQWEDEEGEPEPADAGQGEVPQDVAPADHVPVVLPVEEPLEPPVPPPPAPPRPLAIRPARVQQQWWCRFTVPGMGYFTYKGTNYDRGQLLTLSGGPRDEQLERLGYVYRAPREETYLQAQCGVCQAWFLTEAFRDQHGRLRHRGRFADDLEIGGGMEGPQGGTGFRDITGDADERRMQAQYPLHLDRTKATLEG